MARTVRKVSRANTKDQKKEGKLNKKWWIAIISGIVLVVVGLGLGLGLYYGLKEEETYVSTKIYFNEPVKNTEGNEVSFIKDNYQAIARYMESGEHENIFIFVYDGSAFYADEEDEDKYDAEYAALITRLADLQYTINQAKARGVDVDLYVVDVHVDNSTNAGIMSDKRFGGLYTDDYQTYRPAFIYIQGDEFKEKVEYELDGLKQNDLISTSNWEDVYSTSIYTAIKYINNAL